MYDKTGALHFFLNDHLGSARMVIDSTGVVKDKYKRYFAYGGGASQTISTGQKYQYTGQPYDDDGAFDLYYYGARYYDPVIGRLTSRDRMASKYPTWSPYVYTLDNPVNSIDPNGLWSRPAHNDILETGLRDLVTLEEMAVLQEASASVDKNQNPAYSYMHAMRGPGQTVEEAQAAMEAYIQARTNEFVVGAGENPLFQLGMALHPLMDQTCPSHQGFQEWLGFNVLFLNRDMFLQGSFGLLIHGFLELTISQDELKKTAAIIRAMYLDAIEKQQEYRKEKDNGNEPGDYFEGEGWGAENAAPPPLHRR